ncbi:uncharacterized protein ACN2A1_009647 [Glossina fuscipes fuscipes]
MAEFEKDFDYFLGENWRDTYEKRRAVKKYLEHLEEVNKKSKILLFAYTYQMYMALMSGGQLLQKTRMMARKLWPHKQENIQEQIDSEKPSNPDGLTTRPILIRFYILLIWNFAISSMLPICPDGWAATYFPEKISDLKAYSRTILNKYYGNFDEQTKAVIYNSDVLRSVKGVN